MLRDWCNKIFFTTFRVLIFINQAISLAPVRRRLTAVNGNVEFYTKRWVTIWTIVALIFWTSVSPFIVRSHAEIYAKLYGVSDNLFVFVATGQSVVEAAVALVVLAVLLWQRKQLAIWLNIHLELIREVRHLKQHFVSWKVVGLLWLKVIHALYQYVMNTFWNDLDTDSVSVGNILIYLGLLYMQALNTIFTFDLFAVLLLLYACLTQMEKSLLMENQFTTIGHLLHLEDLVHKSVQYYTSIFQLPIFLILLTTFSNLLANLYTILDLYAQCHTFPLDWVLYCFFIVLDLYSLVFGAYCCYAQHERVRALLMRRRIAQYSTSKNPLWPLVLEFRILGMFSLDHEFWLFLVSYAANYVVLILQFSMARSYAQSYHLKQKAEF